MTSGSVLARLRTSLRDPAMRVRVLALMGGKVIGLALVLAAMRIFLAPAVHADAGGPTPDINALNTAWTLIAAFLVFGMQVGFVMLEAGFARSRESINILVEGIVDTCICGVTFWAWGFAFMFEPGNGFIGTTGFFLQGPRRHLRHDRRSAARVLGLPVRVRRHLLDDHVRRDGRPLRLRRRHPLQHRRHRVHLSDHRPLGLGTGRLAGGDGRCRSATSPDRPSCTRIGGAISLMGAIALGPRLGRVFARDGGGPPLPHNIILGAVGGLILWFGWYGFNPGSTLSALDMQGIGRVSFNTTMAACSAGLAALFYAYARVGKWDLGLTDQRLPGRPGRRSPARATGSARPARSSSASVAGVVGDLGDRRARVPAHRRSDRRGAGAHGRAASGARCRSGSSRPARTGCRRRRAWTPATLVKGLFYGGGTAQLMAQAIGSGAVALRHARRRRSS